MNQVETGKPTPEPSLVVFLTAKEGREFTFFLNLKSSGGTMPIREVMVRRVNLSEGEDFTKKVSLETAEETRRWLLEQNPQGEELVRLSWVQLDFLRIDRLLHPEAYK